MDGLVDLINALEGYQADQKLAALCDGEFLSCFDVTQVQVECLYAAISKTNNVRGEDNANN